MVKGPKKSDGKYDFIPVPQLNYFGPTSIEELLDRREAAFRMFCGSRSEVLPAT